MLEESRFHEVSPTGELVAYADEIHVFDFGGHLDERIIKMAKVCDQCVAPIAFQPPAEIKPFIDTTAESAKHNKNVILLLESISEVDYVIFKTKKRRLQNC